MRAFVFTSPRIENAWGDWSRKVKIGDQEYSVGVKRGKRVRIRFKPRGQNMGWHWHGSVYRLGDQGGFVWEDRVPGSIGCEGLLKAAGLV